MATVNALFGMRRRVDYAAVPRVTFTDPEVAGIGLTEAEARSRWRDPAVVSFDYAELDRAVAEGRAYGFAILIGDPRGRLVGATIAAPGGAESIAELAAWAASGAKIGRVSQTVHAYPTLSEGPARTADAQLRARYAAPATQRVARGGLLDFVADFVVYSGFIVAVAIVHPRARLACVALLATYLVNNVALLAFSSVIERLGLRLGDERSLRLTTGFAEGAETFAVYVLFCVLPGASETIAWGFAAVVAVTAVQRVARAAQILNPRSAHGAQLRSTSTQSDA